MFDHHVGDPVPAEYNHNSKPRLRNRFDTMNILVTDYHCASNRGDAAILEGELAALREEFPRAEFTVMTEYPDAAKAIHGIDAVQQRLVPFETSRVIKNGAVAYALLDATVRGKGVRLPLGKYLGDRLDLQPYYETDLVISTGGHHLTDIYMPDKLGILSEFSLCKRLDKPVVLYAHTLGPFGNTRLSPVIRRVLNSVDLITTREEVSVTHLERLGIDDVPIRSLTDAAFSMPLESDEKESLPFKDGNQFEHLDVTKSETNGLRVSISVRNWAHFGSGSEQAYFEAVAETADWLIDEHDAHVLFASTCTGLDSYHKDDRLAAQEVMDEMDERNRRSVSLLACEYTPRQLAEIYGEMDLHIGTRMHSVILAMLAGTVPVPIGYQFKTRGTMALFDLEEHVLDIDRLNASRLQRRVSETLDNRDDIAEQIGRTLPDVEEMSRANARLIREHVDIR